MKQRWWNSGTSDGETEIGEQWNNNGGTLTQRWGNSGTCDVETVTEEQ